MENKTLNGAQRAAALLLSLPKDQAAEVLRHLREDVISDVADAMSELDPESTTPDKISELMVQLVEATDGPSGVEPADPSFVSALLSDSIGPEKSAEVFGELERRRSTERPFAALEEHPPEALAQILKEESAAVTALVLSHLDPAVSATVLRTYEPSEALDVVRRMSSLTPPGIATLQAIAADIEEQLASAGDAGPATSDPSMRLQTIAEMLSYSGEDIEKAVLTGLETESAEVAQEIREFMFRWEDLGSVDKRSMQKILGSVNTKTLSIALKACTPEVEQNVLGNLSSRVRDMVSEERELAGPTPMSEVQTCRDEVMQAVRALMDSGEFRPTRAGEDIVT